MTQRPNVNMNWAAECTPHKRIISRTWNRFIALQEITQQNHKLNQNIATHETDTCFPIGKERASLWERSHGIRLEEGTMWRLWPIQFRKLFDLRGTNVGDVYNSKKDHKWIVNEVLRGTEFVSDGTWLDPRESAKTLPKYRVTTHIERRF